MAIPRIHVATLYSGESEFEACCARIAGQQGVSVSHVVIRDLSEFEAHQALWSLWETQKHDFDLLVKVDADTVLRDFEALSQIWDVFSKDAEVTGAQIYLHDYFSDRWIAGLNAFRPTVRFLNSSDRLRPDHADQGHRKVLKPDQLKHLAPIGDHAPSPGAEQAVFYGYHRYLKGQTELLEAVSGAYRQKGGEGRRWALVGAELARRDRSILNRAARVLQKLWVNPDSQGLDKSRLFERTKGVPPLFASPNA